MVNQLATVHPFHTALLVQLGSTKYGSLTRLPQSYRSYTRQ